MNINPQYRPTKSYIPDPVYVPNIGLVSHLDCLPNRIKDMLDKPLETVDHVGYRNSVMQAFPIENLPQYNSWGASDWINFHQRLRARYGKDNAKLVWIEYWNNKPHGWLGDKLIGNPEFKSYFKKNGVDFHDNFYSYLTKGGDFLASLPANMRTVAIAGLVIGGVLLVGFIGYQIYSAITIRNIAMGGLKKVADRPDLVAEGITRGAKGGL